MAKTKNPFLPLFAILTAAVLFGSGAPFYQAASLDDALRDPMIAISALIACAVILLIFRSRYRGCGAGGLFLGMGLGVLILLYAFCLHKGGFGILHLTGLMLLCLYDSFAVRKAVSYRDIAAMMLCIGGFVLLTGTVKITLFPFAVDFSLPKLDEAAFFELSASVLSACYYLLCRKVTLVSHYALNAAGQLGTLSLGFGLLWYLENDFALSVPDLRLTMLFLWSALTVALTATLLCVYGISFGQTVQSKCGLLLCIPAAMVMHSVLTRSFPPDFQITAGSLLTLAAFFTAELRPTILKRKKK